MDDLIIDLENSVILEAHLQCASHEVPLTAEDEKYFGSLTKELCETKLSKDKDGWWVSSGVSEVIRQLNHFAGTARTQSTFLIPLAISTFGESKKKSTVLLMSQGLVNLVVRQRFSKSSKFRGRCSRSMREPLYAHSFTLNLSTCLTSFSSSFTKDSPSWSEFRSFIYLDPLML